MRSDRYGFALLEIMMVVLIIGLLAAICIPMFRKARMDTLAVRFVNDIRKASDAFEMYAMEKGSYPPDRNPGKIPPGMSECLPKMSWSAPTVIGGLWDWDYMVPQFGCLAGVSVYRPKWSDAEMLLIAVQRPDGTWIEGVGDHIEKIQDIGPTGWNQAISRFLKTDETS